MAVPSLFDNYEPEPSISPDQLEPLPVEMEPLPTPIEPPSSQMEQTIITPSVLEPLPLSVQAFNDMVTRHVQDLGVFDVEGEITKATYAKGGQMYITLTDTTQAVKQATIACVLWPGARSQIQSSYIREGKRVILTIQCDMWDQHAKFQPTISNIKPVGEGFLLEQQRLLRLKLEAEGLFDPQHKRPLPLVPGAIGLITGKDSDAEQDVIRNVLERWPDAVFRVEHTLVQGVQSPAQIIAALAVLDADPLVDVIVLARGGGSPEDLAGFSDESLVRAVFACQTPVISAIGHTKDNPIVDDVADVRAEVPAKVATLIPGIIPDEEHLQLGQHRQRLANRIDALIAQRAQVIAEWSQRLPDLDHVYTTHVNALVSTHDRLRAAIQGAIQANTVQAEQRRRGLQALASLIQANVATIARHHADMNKTIDTHLERATTRVTGWSQRGRALSPTSVLERGFALVTHDGKTVTSPDGAPVDSLVHIRLASGRISAMVRDHEPDEPTANQPAKRP